MWSISPFGEAKVGIPYGILHGLDKYLVFVVCLIANILIFPLMFFFLEKMNRSLLRIPIYQKSAFYIARKAKKGSSEKINKYGFWGLLFVVMLPVPGTGVYIGTIVSYIFRIEKSKAFLANTIGIIISSIIVWATTVLTVNGV